MLAVLMVTCSAGMNYNINYNSNTNIDLTQLYRTIWDQLSGSEIKACRRGRCETLYQHLAVSFSSDQEEDDYVDEDNLFANDDYQTPISGDTKLDASVVPFNQSDGIISSDSK